MLKPSAFSITWPPAATLQARDLDLVDRVEHRLAGVVGQQVRALVVVDDRERGVAVLGDLGRAAGRERAAHATTCGIRSTFASSGAIWARTFGAVAEPCALCQTIVSVSPLWAGNSLLSRSTTCWDSVPGRLKSVA